MEYKFADIEKKWQDQWNKNEVYKVLNDINRPKYYVLDMFPYPSGTGLHVGHPLGYIASDIYARFKRLKGFNVLHPMGYDAFGLPAEQYAIDHGIHPAVSTEQNINNFRKQLDKIGFSFDWSRQVKTSDAGYYKWTQWIFLQLFQSWYNRSTQKAESIKELIKIFEEEGNKNYPFPNTQFQLPANKLADPQSHPNFFTATDWKAFDEATRQSILMEYRLAYCGYGEVNWCEALGTVLANDEVINGVSERGGYPVVKKKLRQWYLRITEYADRLLEGLERIEFSEAMKEMQTNWIGKSYGAEIEFGLTPEPSPEGEGRHDENRASGFFKTADKKYWNILKQYWRDNRKNPTEAEDILWQRLRNNQLGVKARRQHSIEGYIVDFALLEVKLVIEIDGQYYNESEQKHYDKARTAYLKEFGLDMLRFTNEEVINHTNTVIEKIKTAIAQRKTNSKSITTSPLSFRRGAGGEVKLKVYTTRPDTIFGVDFMVISPEHEFVEKIATPAQKVAVEEYIAYVKSRSERERMAEKKITGCFTGAYAINPFDDREIPVWISEYVLAGYGTGAIMAVPCGDERDFKFAKHFNIPVTNIIGKHFNGEEANPTKDAILENSGFLNGLLMHDAIDIVNQKIEELGIGERKVNYRMRDAAFSRQRYWGEPFPIAWKNGIAYPLDEKELPLELPHVDSYKPGPEGEGPLANIPAWVSRDLETNTMPGYAGSSWYFLRYMDPHNQKEFCSRKASDYWGQVDLYIGGTEHAVGHLLYSRMWTKALYDLGHIGHDEPYKKLVNQGMIQGSSRFVYRVEIPLNQSKQIFISKKHFEKYKDGNIINLYELLQFIKNLIPDIIIDFEEGSYALTKLTSLHTDVNIVDGVELNKEAFRKWRPEFKEALFVCEDGTISSPTGGGREGAYICGTEVEKMSKSKFNTVNPDDLVAKYGADTFRMYEMFLGPVEQSKPWDTKGIEGVHRFLKKLWRLFYDDIKGKIWTAEKATDAELKILHKTIKKIEEDTERFSFNTAVSAFMIAVNELSDLKSHKREILERLLVLLAPYAPHIAEELWQALGNHTSIINADFPTLEMKWLVESAKNYPVAINGKTRTELNISLDATQQQVEEMILSDDVVKKWLEGKSPKKIIYVKNKMINVVV